MNLFSPEGDATLELSAPAGDGDVIKAFNGIPHWQQSAPATFYGLGRLKVTRKAADATTAPMAVEATMQCSLKRFSSKNKFD